MCVCANEYYDKIIEANDDSNLSNKRNDKTEKTNMQEEKEKEIHLADFMARKKD